MNVKSDRTGHHRVRFRDAVPVRADRRDLRRRFRRAARAAMGERKAEMTAVLRRLSAGHVTLACLIPEPRDEGRTAVFADGTRLFLEVRSGGDMKRLGRYGSRHPVWLAEVQPCFGRRWFRLAFTSDARALPLEVLASVGPVPPGGRGVRT